MVWSVDMGGSTLPGDRYGELNQDVVFMQELAAKPGASDRPASRAFVGVVLDGEQAASAGAMRQPRGLGNLRFCDSAFLLHAAPASCT